MRRDDESDLQRVPKNVLFSVFAGHWRSRTGQQVYCTAFRPLEEPFRAWAEELEQVSVAECLRYAMTKLAKTE